MEKIIRKSIDGGYHSEIESITGMDFDSVCTDGFYYIKNFDKESNLYRFDIYKTFLDKNFWQSLGKACGWDKLCSQCGNPENIHEYRHRFSKNEFNFSWKDRALTFHEINLTEGFSKAVEWLEELIKE